jgi:phosphoribosylformylglycinamidine synthase
VKSGLLPYGRIKDLDENSPTLAHNAIRRHISQMVNVQVVNDESPWLTGMVRFSPSRFLMAKAVSWLQKKKSRNCMKTDRLLQYIDLDGNIAHGMPFNPNNSLFGIEGVTKPVWKDLRKNGTP